MSQVYSIQPSGDKFFVLFLKIKISYFHGDIVINTTRGYLSLVINNMNGRTLVREIHG